MAICPRHLAIILFPLSELRDAAHDTQTLAKTCLLEYLECNPILMSRGYLAYRGGLVVAGHHIHPNPRWLGKLWRLPNGGSLVPPFPLRRWILLFNSNRRLRNRRLGRLWLSLSIRASTCHHQRTPLHLGLLSHIWWLGLFLFFWFLSS